jgi:hypothetical protein
MTYPRNIFLCVLALFSAILLMAEGALPKDDLVELQTIVFLKTRHRSEELLRLIDDTFARIRRGEDFRALATRVSDDDSVNYAEHLVDTATLLRPVLKALRRLDPGETSDLIVTDKCYIIIKLVRRPKGNSTGSRGQTKPWKPEIPQPTPATRTNELDMSTMERPVPTQE